MTDKKPGLTTRETIEFDAAWSGGRCDGCGKQAPSRYLISALQDDEALTPVTRYLYVHEDGSRCDVGMVGRQKSVSFRPAPE